MYTNKEIEINGKKIVLYHNSKTGLIGIISGDIGDILCDVKGKVKGKVTGSVGGVGGSIIGDVGKSVFGSIGGEVSGNIKGNVMGTIYGYVKGSITKYVGINVGDVYGSVMGKITGNVGGNIDGDVQGTIFGSVMGSIVKKVMGNVGSLTGKVMDEVETEQIENKIGDNMEDGNSFFETVIGGITDGVDDSTKNEIENNNANKTGDKMEQADSEVKMNELGSLEYMYERMQQIRQGKREGYVNKLDEALDSFEDILLAESQIYEAVDNCKDGTDTHKSKKTHNHTETDKVTDTVTPEKGKKKDGLKEEDGGKKAKNDQAHENKPVTTLPVDEKDTTAGGDKHIPTFEDMFNYKFGRSQPEATNKSREDLDAEEIATINALIDKVEDSEKDGVTNDAQLVDKQQLQKLYGGMLRTQLEGSEKYKPCITKYQDTFPVHAFIVAVNMASEFGDGIEYKFGKVQRKLSSVYTEMRALQKSYGSDEWDTCIKAYKDTFPIAGENYAITQESNFYLKRTK